MAPVTAALTLSAANREPTADGNGNLDDDVHDYVSEVAAFRHLMKLRKRIHHTSGLRDQRDLLLLSVGHPIRGLLRTTDRVRDLRVGAHRSAVQCDQVPGNRYPCLRSAEI